MGVVRYIGERWSGKVCGLYIAGLCEYSFAITRKMFEMRFNVTRVKIIRYIYFCEIFKI